MTTYLTDPSDFCRHCKGSGLERDGHVVSPCYDCNGTGHRSVIVYENCGGVASALTDPNDPTGAAGAANRPTRQYYPNA